MKQLIHGSNLYFSTTLLKTQSNSAALNCLHVHTQKITSSSSEFYLKWNYRWVKGKYGQLWIEVLKERCWYTNSTTAEGRTHSEALEMCTRCVCVCFIWIKQVTTTLVCEVNVPNAYTDTHIETKCTGPGSTCVCTRAHAYTWSPLKKRYFVRR